MACSKISVSDVRLRGCANAKSRSDEMDTQSPTPEASSRNTKNSHLYCLRMFPLGLIPSLNENYGTSTCGLIGLSALLILLDVVFLVQGGKGGGRNSYANNGLNIVILSIFQVKN